MSIRHSPCEKYIEYLIVHPEGWSNEAVLEIVRAKQLDFIGPGYIERLRRDLHPPDPFHPENRFHKASARFLTVKKLRYLFHPDAAMSGALRVLEDPQAKELVETMLITQDPDALIVRRLQKTGVSVPLLAIERYRFFFFNVHLVDRLELNALLSLRAGFVLSAADEYDTQVAKALKQCRTSDPRLAAARYPISSAASALSALRMGYMPSRLDLAQVLTAGRAAATLRAVECTVDGGRAADARDWALAGKLLGEILQEVGSPDATLQRELQSLALAVDGSQIPYIAELSGGNHTMDLQPLEAEGVGRDE